MEILDIAIEMVKTEVRRPMSDQELAVIRKDIEDEMRAYERALVKTVQRYCERRNLR